MALVLDLLKSLKGRPRLLVGIVVGAAAAVLATVMLHWRLGLIIGWDVGTLLVIGATIPMMMRFNRQQLKTHARREDEGAPAILALSALAGLASLGAIILLLADDSGATPKPVGILLAVLTILASWMFIHTEFALHYARLYYAEEKNPDQAALDFPGEEHPDFADFLYFSAVIGMTSQTADVGIRDRSIRRLVIGHGMLSFFFNTTVVALFINIAAGLIGK